jgi:hypothetical protein
MPFNHADDLTATVRYALETTRALAACPFHPDVMIRVGDDAVETHAYERPKRVVKSDGTSWKREALSTELERQLVERPTATVRNAQHRVIPGAKTV